jgi:hypothetical protein
MQRLFFCIIGMVLVILTAYIASKKNRNVVLWTFLGMFVPLVSLIIVIFLPTKAAPVAPVPSSPKIESRPIIKCPECGAPTFDLAHHRHQQNIPDRS